MAVPSTEKGILIRVVRYKFQKGTCHRPANVEYGTRIFRRASNHRRETAMNSKNKYRPTRYLFVAEIKLLRSLRWNRISP